MAPEPLVPDSKMELVLEGMAPKVASEKTVQDVQAIFKERTRCKERLRKPYCKVQKLTSCIGVLHVSCVKSRVAAESILMPNLTSLIA